MARVLRWLPGVLLGLSTAMAIGSVVDQRWGAAVLWALAAVFWGWQVRRPATATTTPAHVDEQWARDVLAAAGAPSGVRAVRALREAEPGLSLLDAKQLVDRVGG
jgi:ribosomal protein L7/L12